MTEIAYTPPFELWKTDHGTDGWDAKTWVVAKFTTEEKAISYLNARGFTFNSAGSYYHQDSPKRNAMGALSYKIVPVKLVIPTDPQ